MEQRTGLRGEIRLQRGAGGEWRVRHLDVVDQRLARQVPDREVEAAGPVRVLPALAQHGARDQQPGVVIHELQAQHVNAAGRQRGDDAVVGAGDDAVLGGDQLTVRRDRRRRRALQVAADGRHLRDPAGALRAERHARVVHHPRAPRHRGRGAEVDEADAVAPGRERHLRAVVRGRQRHHAGRQLQRGLAHRVRQADPVQHGVSIDMQAPRTIARYRERCLRGPDLEQVPLLVGHVGRGLRAGQRGQGGDREGALERHVRTSSAVALLSTIATPARVRAEGTLTPR